MERLTQLEPLDSNDWPLVRDITIPIERGDSASYSVTECAIQEATCFIGEPAARRLWNESDAASMQRMLQLFSKIDPSIQLGFDRFRVDLDGMSFRAQLGANAQGQDLSLRVLPQQAPTLNDLRMPAAWRALMLDQSLLNGGLVLIVAPNGQGKTTTASAIVRSRLEQFGGFANTCEDPIELPLQGTWGHGVCMQRPANQKSEDSPGEGYHRAMLQALRQFPAITGGGTILFVGEIGDAQTAAETLKAAANGHLVVSTLHAKSVPAALRRMATLCAGGRDAMDIETVRDLLADSLRGVFYQNLVWQKDGEGWGRAQIKGDLLWTENHDSAAAKAIRGGRFDDLHGLVKRQTAALRPLDGKDRVPAAEVRALLRGDQD